MTSDQIPVNKLLAYAQLFRLPNLFTALADIAAGYLFVRGFDVQFQFLPFVCLLLASGLLYTAGMVLNDVFDYEQDLRERRERPLPSGRISRSGAARLGWAMLALGVALGWLAGLFLFKNEAIALPYRSGVVATLLVAMIVAYNSLLKRTPLGPLAMGSCRFLNLLLGMSTASAYWTSGSAWTFYYSAGQLLLAGGLGVYVAGVTWFARTEADESKSLHLVGALCVLVAGLALIAGYAWMPGNEAHFRPNGPVALAQMRTMWPVLIMLIGVTIIRRAMLAVQRPIPSRVQATVKLAITSIILLDAAIAMLVGPMYAIGVLALLAPTVVLGYWVYST